LNLSIAGATNEREPFPGFGRERQFDGGLHASAALTGGLFGRDPPEEVKRDKPSLPNVIPGGSPTNPMGAAALTLSGGGEYAIHGTNNPGSVGGFVSYGCIRMYNADVLDLYNRVSWGAPVVVTR
jgi:L,D-transpeptidase catalytic domain